MGKRQKILVGMAAGVLWAVAVIWTGRGVGFVMPQIGLTLAFAPPGLVMVLMVGLLANRRFLNDDIIDGQPYAPGSPASIDQKVLVNTTEQAVLALLIWPFVAFSLGGQVTVVMGLAFAIARLAFWIGYHLSPPLRAFGFAATFYTTVLAGVWSLVVWL